MSHYSDCREEEADSQRKEDLRWAEDTLQELRNFMWDRPKRHHPCISEHLEAAKKELKAWLYQG